MALPRVRLHHLLKWAIKNMVYLDFIDAAWIGAVDDATAAKGFSCGSSPLCFGRTGVEVLASLHDSYDAIEAEDKLVKNAMILLGIGIGYKLMYFASFVRKSQKAKTIDAPK